MNEGDTVDFLQDLSVMDQLINIYTTEDQGSMDDVFADVAIKNEMFPNGWKEFDGTIEKKAVLQKHGARLLLLLAYVMISNVLDDHSNEFQM